MCFGVRRKSTANYSKSGLRSAQSSVAKYMVKRRGPPSQGWETFLRNHAPDIAAMDLFVVPNIGFILLYGFVIVRIDRRDPTRRRSGSHARSPRRFLGTVLRVT
jgi:hypothetical protein